MGKTVGESPKSKPATIVVPPRGLLFSTGSGPGFSPGPMTLVSNMFSDQSPFSFSQLLAGAMASPAPAPEGSNPLFTLNSPAYVSPLQSPFGMSHQQALAHVTAQAVLSQSFKQMQAEFHHSAPKHPSEPDPTLETSQPDKKPGDHSKPVGDGYNWRKYGQKLVKASEGPRSYYKCTQPNCSVKKKVERALDGCVSEVTYKGEHNHDLPKHNKRGKDSCVETNSGSKEAVNNVHLESTTTTVVEHHGGNSDDCHKEDEDEPIAKRRSLDSGSSMPASTQQAVTEPKIVLQTRSEVDLLDDGYKWRKYGQKVVKGNPYPRSYYKCTYADCNVRKHVERASVDPKAVITTYEGKHNHEIPTGRRTNAQHLKAPKKKVSKNASIDEEETDYEDKDNNNNNNNNKNNIPMNLELKQGQITA